MFGQSRAKNLMFCALMVFALHPAVGSAEGLSFSKAGKDRMSIFKAQTRLMDTRLAGEYSDSVRLTPHYKKSKGAESGVIPVYAGNYRGAYLEQAKTAARKYGVPEDLFLRLVQRESGWNHNAVSVKGATGLAQLMPATARVLGVDMTDPVQNLDGGARYLKMMYDRFGSWRLALAAYNAGPIAVEQNGGVPPYDETQAYVVAILGS